LGGGTRVAVFELQPEARADLFVATLIVYWNFNDNRRPILLILAVRKHHLTACTWPAISWSTITVCTADGGLV